MADDVTGVEVGTAYVTVLPSTKGFHKALAGDVNQAAAAAGQSGGAAAGTGFMAGFGKFAPMIGGAIGGIFAAGKVKDFLADSLAAGSDLAESQSKVSVVFGDSAKAVEAWASTSSTSLLMSSQQALEASGTYGALLTALGLTKTAAAGMSQSAVQMAADWSSFNNADPSETLLAIRSALVGEYEPARRFGSALSMARVQQEALNEGLWDGTGKLDQAGQAQATLALLLRDTATATGDVDRTSAGWANTQRALSAEIDNTMAKIGTGLLSAVNQTTTALGGPGGMVATISAVGDRSGAAAENIGKLAGSFIWLGEKVTEAGNEQPGWMQWLFDSDHQLGWGWLGQLGTVAQAVDTVNVATTAMSAAQQANVRSGTSFSKALLDQAAAGGVAAQASRFQFQSLVDLDQQTTTATKHVSMLETALAGYQDRASAGAAGTALRDSWRALTEGGTKSVKVNVPNPKWQPGSSVPRYVEDTKTVDTAFAPSLVGGRFAFNASGDDARDRISDVVQRAMTKYATLPAMARPAFLEKQIDRLGGQLEDWGIRNPYRYARNQFPDYQPYQVASARAMREHQADRAPLQRGGGDTYNMYGNITTGPNDDLTERLKQDAHQAKASRVPHGALSPTR